MTSPSTGHGPNAAWVDVVADFDPRRRRPDPEVVVTMGMVIEDRATGFCGDVVRITSEAVTLRDRKGNHRDLRYKPGGFLLEGRAVSLTRAAPVAAQVGRTNSGSIPAPDRRATQARASRIWVEGRHDAELLEHVWGDDLRELGIVVEPLHGIDGLVCAVSAFGPGPDRRLGILVDHLVEGSKEHHLARQVDGPAVLVTGHPFVDVWEGVRPKVIGLDEWPVIPRGVVWKDAICAALGADPSTFWPRLRNRVRSFADLRPELVGAVERLIDFVSPPTEGS